MGPSSSGLTRFLEPTWDMWWYYHREEFLDLKRVLAQGGVRSRGELTELDVATHSAQVREALCAALDQREHPELCLGAMVAAARIGDGSEHPEDLSFGPRIRALLSSPRSETAELAALSLGVLASRGLADPLEVNHLEGVLRDNEAGRKLTGTRSVSQRQRCFAAYGLGLHGARTQDTRQRQIIARALTDMLQREDGRSLELDIACIQALAIVPLPMERTESHTAAWISRQTQVRFLSDLAARPALPQAVEAHALRALGQLARNSSSTVSEQALQRSFQRLRDPSTPAPIRAAAAQAMAAAGDADADALDAQIGRELLRSTQVRDMSERASALIGLAETAQRAGSGETPLARRENLRKELLSGLESGRARIVAWSALALGVLEHGSLREGAAGDGTTREALRKAFAGSQTIEERSALAISIGLTRDPEGASLLLKALGAQSEDTLRGYLALGLGMAGSSEASPTLRELALNARNKPFLLEQSAIALALLGDRTLAPALIEQLRDSRSLAAQAWLSRTIGMISENESVPALLKIAVDDKLGQDPRAQALLALGRILDPEPLPWIQPYNSSLDYRNPTPAMIAGDGSGLLELQ
ncbi:MAG: HEAT repeat domain-containing protein [Planctomycetia bacterium]